MVLQTNCIKGHSIYPARFLYARLAPSLLLWTGFVLLWLFAAKMLMMLAGNEKEVMLMRQTKDGHVVSKQQDNREVGFRHYMHDHFHR